MATNRFAEQLEREGLLFVDRETFALTSEEQRLLAASHGQGKAKNISLAPGAKVRGAKTGAAEEALIQSLLTRYGVWARELLIRLAPAYASALEVGRASFRPRGVEDAPISVRKDDRRLHVDAFASRPTGGKRILRVFCNINPAGEDRVWRVGEPFEAHARRWASLARALLPGEAALLQALGVTRGRRTPYDALMLQLHDRAKFDTAYQAIAPCREIRFPPGSVWIVYTDSVPHAAVAGRHALEQTFYLPLAAMVSPEVSPARVLERLTGRKLVPA